MCLRPSETTTDQCPAGAANPEVVTVNAKPVGSGGAVDHPSPARRRHGVRRETLKQNAAPGHMQ